MLCCDDISVTLTQCFLLWGRATSAIFGKMLFLQVQKKGLLGIFNSFLILDLNFRQELGFEDTKARLELGLFGGSQKGGFQKVHSDAPLYQKKGRGYIRMFYWTKNRNEGTFAKTAFYEATLLFPLELWGWDWEAPKVDNWKKGFEFRGPRKFPTMWLPSPPQ